MEFKYVDEFKYPGHVMSSNVTDGNKNLAVAEMAAHCCTRQFVVVEWVRTFLNYIYGYSYGDILID